MTILHLLHTYDVTGGATRALTLKKWWPKPVRHAVIGMCYGGTIPTMKSIFEKAGFFTQEIPHSDTWALWQAISRVKGKIRGVIIYNWEPSDHFIDGLYRFGYKGETIVRIDTVLPESVGPRMKSIDRKNVTYVSISYAARQRFDKLWAPWYSAGLKWSRSLLVRNSPDETIFKPVPWRENPNPMRVGFAGRLADDKHHDILIHAAGMTAYPMKIVIAGDGKRRAELEAEAARLAPGKIEFLGTIPFDQMPDFYHSLDVYVQASLEIEGSSNALLEAARCRLPLICTDVPSHREIDTGATFIDASPDADHTLARVLDRLAAEPAMRSTMRSNVEIARANESYRVADMVNEYVVLLEG